MKAKPIFLGLLVTLFFSVSMSAQNPGHSSDVREYKTRKGKEIAIKKTKARLNKLCDSGYKITRKELYRGGTWKMHFTTSCGHTGEVHFRYDGDYKETIYHN
ncbi:hypothetical protein [Kordia sp.]|uniref:hypothetical protein n=1 Tax=Kordia sp. TaxID=1965332 RepID=UPI003D6BA1D4